MSGSASSSRVVTPRAASGPTARDAGGTVLCVGNFASDTGYAWRLMERLWVRLAEVARAQGGDAIVAFPRVNGIPGQLRAAGLRVVELQVPTSLPAPLGELRRFITQNRVRTLYLTDRPYWSPVYALFRTWGVRSIILHDHIPGERPRPPRWKLRAKRLRFLAPGAAPDLYIGVSDFVNRRFSEVAGVPRQRCTSVHNGVDVSVAPARDIRAVAGIAADAPVVVSSGRLHVYKGIDFLIRCAARLIHERGHAEVRFIHIGDGPHRNRFEPLVRELDLAGRFIMLGARDDVPSLLASSTIALHASHGEAFSLAILEFMAAGLPAVVPDHCGNGEAIEHGESGVLYRPGDLDEAVRWLERLLDDDALRSRLGEAARRRAQSEFSLEHMDRAFRAAVTPFTRTGGQNSWKAARP